MGAERVLRLLGQVLGACRWVWLPLNLLLLLSHSFCAWRATILPTTRTFAAAEEPQTSSQRRQCHQRRWHSLISRAFKRLCHDLPFRKDSPYTVNMNYLAPPDQTDEQPHCSSSSSVAVGVSKTFRLTSRSASPCRRERANSLTQDSVEASPSPQLLRKRPPRHTQLNELFRPRCNTDPSRSGSKKSSVLGSLLRQTLKVTTASVGLSGSEERWV